MSSYFQIPITGRLIDPVGDPVTGASVFFRAKATTKGLESVPKTTVASFETDSGGYYQTAIPSGWYSIEFARPGDLDTTKLGAATVTGTETLDLGTLLANSIPPPSQLQGISDVSISGRQDGSTLTWNSSRNQWSMTGGLLTTGTSRTYSTAVSVGQSGAWVSFNPHFSATPRIQMTASFTGDSQWLVSARNVSVSGVSGIFSSALTENATLYTSASLL